MTTTTALPAYPRPQRVTQIRVMRSEWTKLRTQPAALWALLSAVILVIAFGNGYSLLAGGQAAEGRRSGCSPRCR